MFIERENDIQNDQIDFLQIFITFLVVLACLLLIVLFPAESGFEKLTKSIFFMILVPVLYIKFVLKKTIRDFGFNIEEKHTGLFWGGIMTVASLAIAFILINYSDFRTEYVLPSATVNSFWYFVAYELIFVNFLLFIYEFFFRGFILFYLSQKFKMWTVPVQAGIYWISLIATHSFSWNMAPMIILSLTAGITAYKSRSFIFSYLSGLIFMIILDAYMIHSVR